MGRLCILYRACDRSVDEPKSGHTLLTESHSALTALVKVLAVSQGAASSSDLSPGLSGVDLTPINPKLDNSEMTLQNKIDTAILAMTQNIPELEMKIASVEVPVQATSVECNSTVNKLEALACWCPPGCTGHTPPPGFADTSAAQALVSQPSVVAPSTSGAHSQVAVDQLQGSKDP